jgi:hypothetical protein
MILSQLEPFSMQHVPSSSHHPTVQKSTAEHQTRRKGQHAWNSGETKIIDSIIIRPINIPSASGSIEDYLCFLVSLYKTLEKQLEEAKSKFLLIVVVSKGS